MITSVITLGLIACSKKDVDTPQAPTNSTVTLKSKGTDNVAALGKEALVFDGTLSVGDKALFALYAAKITYSYTPLTSGLFASPAYPKNVFLVLKNSSDSVLTKVKVSSTASGTTTYDFPKNQDGTPFQIQNNRSYKVEIYATSDTKIAGIFSVTVGFAWAWYGGAGMHTPEVSGHTTTFATSTVSTVATAPSGPVFGSTSALAITLTGHYQQAEVTTIKVGFSTGFAKTASIYDSISNTLISTADVQSGTVSFPVNIVVDPGKKYSFYVVPEALPHVGAGVLFQTGLLGIEYNTVFGEKAKNDTVRSIANRPFYRSKLSIAQAILTGDIKNSVEQVIVQDTLSAGLGGPIALKQASYQLAIAGTNARLKGFTCELDGVDITSSVVFTKKDGTRLDSITKQDTYIHVSWKQGGVGGELVIPKEKSMVLRIKAVPYAFETGDGFRIRMTADPSSAPTTGATLAPYNDGVKLGSKTVGVFISDISSKSHSANRNLPSADWYAYWFEDLAYQNWF